MICYLAAHNFFNFQLGRQENIGNLLDEVLRGTLKHDVEFTPLPDNFVLIDEIILIPEFVSLNCTYEDIVELVHGDPKLRFSIRGSKVRLKPPELNKDRDVIISKKLSWILRHGAQKVGLTYGHGGFLYLDDVLRLRDFNGITEADVQRVVENNNKQRFELSVDDASGRQQIRAFQGHSVKVEGLDLIPITDASEYPLVVHGTYWRNWDRIRQGGLSRMNRTHIHFAPGEIGESGVISGMRNSVEVLIYVDLAAALRDGYRFFLSPNRVILTEGNADGYLPSKYFTKVFQCQPREL
ncbi:tRNA phosphotransferase 1 [Fasciola gigantica]|uniref:2'-phosphotransferase n=2 Tax=Fasciola TaxID=6191 RepID=A0A504YUI7_FASGI|nr:tRNA phosphotransferase 1 [Fasciola gigantica]